MPERDTAWMCCTLLRCLCNGPGMFAGGAGEGVAECSHVCDEAVSSTLCWALGAVLYVPSVVVLVLLASCGAVASSGYPFMLVTPL